MKASFHSARVDVVPVINPKYQKLWQTNKCRGEEGFIAIQMKKSVLKSTSFFLCAEVYRKGFKDTKHFASYNCQTKVKGLQG